MWGAVAAVEATVSVDRWHWFEGWKPCLFPELEACGSHPPAEQTYPVKLQAAQLQVDG
jgi:hypothetical protein